MIVGKEEIKEGLKRLKPPSADAPLAEVQAWRWFIAILLGVNTVASAFHILLACGYVTSLYPGFARADEVRDLQSYRATDLGLKIIDTKEKQCAAADVTLAALYREAITRMEAEYAKLVGREFKTPQCSEFRS